MDYFINQIIHFDALNGSLNLIDNHNSIVQLSRPSSRLLSELITHCGKTLSREELLKSVWEAHGLRPSGSNLSNHISFLRKTFSQLGLNENIIYTVPKKGFRLEADITLARATPSEDKSTITGINKKKGMNFAFTPLKNAIAPYIKKILLPALLSIAFILASVMVVTYLFNTKIKPGHFINLCQLVDLSQNPRNFTDEKLKTLKRLIKEQGINCLNKKSTINFRFTNFFPEKDYEQKVAFISQCYPRTDNKIENCENYLSATLKKP
ncbi:winged helix-turn-helix domain-containing protein [Erwinia persicina]|uniref:winged helix-turn-helix domain-containing protein n=1 Tax=Erwinia persicina TaxID=55211 RepID=UPI00093200FC|nr:winged helix-turn-helix domain-containing protein [Erwinia persicina]